MLILQEQKKRWEAVAAEVARRCEVERELRDVNEWAEELGEELSVARRSARSATKSERAALSAKSKAQSVASKRQAELSALKAQLSETTTNEEKKVELAKQKDLADKGDAYITSLIFYAMWGTAACWTTVSQITKGLKGLKFKKDKQQALKDNIQMWWKGFGFGIEKSKTTWAEGERQKSIAELTKILRDILKMWKKEKWKIPDKPPVPVPKRKKMAQMGTLTNYVKVLDDKAESKSSEFELKYRRVWRERNVQGDSRRQQHNPPPVDDTLKGF